MCVVASLQVVLVLGGEVGQFIVFDGFELRVTSQNFVESLGVIRGLERTLVLQESLPLSRVHHNCHGQVSRQVITEQCCPSGLLRRVQLHEIEGDAALDP